MERIDWEWKREKMGKMKGKDSQVLIHLVWCGETFIIFIAASQLPSMLVLLGSK